MLFEIFVGFVLFVSFVSVLVDQAPDVKDKREDKK
jgi:hypothetical protein